MKKEKRIVIGTWPLSGDYGYVNLRTIKDTLDYCYDNGFKEFDTAPIYGNGFMEFCLGNVFYGKKDVLINTKIGNIPFKGKSFKLEDLKESFEQSLKRLNRESINILFLHNPRLDEIKDYYEIIKFMEKLKSENKIRYIGISLAKNYDYSGKIDLGEFDVVQDDANLLKMDFLKYDLPENTSFMARSPLASGLLSGKLDLTSKFSKDDHRSEWLKGERLESLLKRVESIKNAFNIPVDIDLPSLARRFVLNNYKIDSVIFGIKSIKHVNEIIQDINVPLDPISEKKLIELFKKDFYLIDEKKLGY